MTEPAERDEYEVFLDTWMPSERLVHASLPHNVSDPLIGEQLILDSTGDARVLRTVYAPGPKELADEEWATRAFEFFADRQAAWSRDFEDVVTSRGVPGSKFDPFVKAMAADWVDGKARRQKSPAMLSIRASVRDHDLHFHRSTAGRFTLLPVADGVCALFEPEEMEIIFETNESLLQQYLPDYLSALDHHHVESVSDLTVRRGIYLKDVPTERYEASELNSYSLGLGVPEQFAQTWVQEDAGRGQPCLISAPLPAVQKRIVAFAPFIANMTLEQMELVVAPPLSATRLTDCGSYGAMHELSFY